MTTAGRIILTLTATQLAQAQEQAMQLVALAQELAQVAQQILVLIRELAQAQELEEQVLEQALAEVELVDKMHMYTHEHIRMNTLEIVLVSRVSFYLPFCHKSEFNN